ncbi:hypothetical protein HYU13_01940 [Candidatus Woesearchaeota archaeon]|nr:hypothetical protein [Candidatus Woesearchaeota archaeon]
MNLQSPVLEEIARMDRGSSLDKPQHKEISLFYTFDTRGYDCCFPVRE